MAFSFSDLNFNSVETVPASRLAQRLPSIFRYIREQSKKADSSDLPVSGDLSRTHTNEESAPICQDRKV